MRRATFAALGVLLILLATVAGAQAPAPPGSIRQIATRGTFTLVVRADGSVVGWGRDPDGQAARPPSPKRVITTPVVIELPGKVLQVALGQSTQYALLEDGTVVSWGTNDEGQLGNGPMGANGELGRYPAPSVTPVRVTGLTGIVQIAAGMKHAVALKNDGTVWAWGRRDNGEIGDGEPKGLRALRALGPTRVPGLEGITQIAADFEHNLALRSDGRVMAWGQNRNGELGNGTRNIGWKPAEVPGLDRVVAIAAGVGSFAGAGVSGALRDDGTLWMWGSNASAMMGNGLGPLSPDDEGGRVLAPIQVKGITGAKRLSIGFGHVAVLLADGTLRTWGHTGFGQTGVPASDGEYTTKPAKPDIANVTAVYLGGYHSFAVGSDGSLWTWGNRFLQGVPGFLGTLHRAPTRMVLELPGQGDPKAVVSGLHGLSLHDTCTGDYAPQPDTCLHEQLLERTVTVGGKPGTVHDVTLRIEGIFEPTTIEGGETPLAGHPYYKVGGTIRARDWSAWHIEVSDPKQTYWLNHYPKVSHTIYKQDFEATIPMAAGASVTVRVIDGNDRQIDNAEPGRPDRLQIIKALSGTPLAGQMLRLEVLRVAVR